MEELCLNSCDTIIRLKVSCLLNRFSCLSVFHCKSLEVIENRAPNLCFVRIDGAVEKLPIGDLLQMKRLHMLDYYESDLVHDARSKLPFIMPNLETLNLSSAGEVYSQTLVFPLLFLQG